MARPAAMNLLPILTDRLVLRRFGLEDLDAFQSYRTDPEVARLQGWEPMSIEEARAYLAEQSGRMLGPAGEWLQVAITRRDSGLLIGDLGLCVIDETAGIVEIGYTVARMGQGQGHATEAVTAIVDTLLAPGRFAAIVATTDARNAPSLALLRRLGFRLQRSASTTFRGEACVEHTFTLSRPP